MERVSSDLKVFLSTEKALQESNILTAYLDDRLVIAAATEERFAALAGEGPEVEAGGRLLAHPAQLVLQRVNLVNL